MSSYTVKSTVGCSSDVTAGPNWGTDKCLMINNVKHTVPTKGNSIASVQNIKNCVFAFVFILFRTFLFVSCSVFFHVAADVQSCQPPELSREFGLFPGGLLDAS